MTRCASQCDPDLLPNRGPRRTGNIAKLLLAGHRRLESAAVPGRPSPRGAHSDICAVAPGGVKWGSHGVKAHTLSWSNGACTPHEFKVLKGRWDRNRTCHLRVWSLLPYVQQRSGRYANRLEIGPLAGAKYVEVRERSPALGDKNGVEPQQPSSIISHGRHQGAQFSAIDTDAPPGCHTLATHLPHSCHGTVILARYSRQGKGARPRSGAAPRAVSPPSRDPGGLSCQRSMRLPPQRRERAWWRGIASHCQPRRTCAGFETWAPQVAVRIWVTAPIAVTHRGTNVYHEERRQGSEACLHGGVVSSTGGAGPSWSCPSSCSADSSTA